MVYTSNLIVTQIQDGLNALENNQMPKIDSRKKDIPVIIHYFNFQCRQGPACCTHVLSVVE